MAKKPMARLGVRVMRVGEFLDEVYRAEPEATARAVCRAAEDLKKPPYTIPELLAVLRKMGAKTLVLEMSRELGVTPVQKEQSSEH
ncbi:hypothetical protein [Ralstonia solanacearum]|uniref:hypothetical protein n=1 Tax=Ralstonia solanacearum TaxID=305 RepID=UPI000505CA05|nr:hypothetical protein [Ralstonia solanacearum]KFX29941.1 hypothetical protein KR96_04575 [Ralstonia solanacearum]